MEQALAKYRIGLALIGLLAVIFAIIVMVQAGATRQDSDTYAKASKAAEKLNNYISTSGSIPESLAKAGVKDVPESLTYIKISDSSYKFCTDYNSTSSGFSAASVESDLITSTAGQSGGSSGGNSDASSLYIDTVHKKGKNCQTIKPYVYSSTTSGGPSTSGSQGATQTPSTSSGGGSSSGGSSSLPNTGSGSTGPAAACVYDPSKGDAGSQAYIDCVSKAYGGN